MLGKSFVFDTPGVPFLIDLQAPQILVSFLIHLRQSHVFANTQKIPVMWVAQFLMQALALLITRKTTVLRGLTVSN